MGTLGQLVEVGLQDVAMLSSKEALPWLVGLGV